MDGRNGWMGRIDRWIGGGDTSGWFAQTHAVVSSLTSTKYVFYVPHSDDHVYTSPLFSHETHDRNVESY